METKVVFLYGAGVSADFINPRENGGLIRDIETKRGGHGSMGPQQDNISDGDHFHALCKQLVGPARIQRIFGQSGVVPRGLLINSSVSNLSCLCNVACSQTG